MADNNDVVVRTRHIADYTQDPDNLREHNPRNIGVIVDSLHEVGAGRSLVADENDVIRAGNGTLEAAAEAGITRVIEVETDGTELVVVKRKNLNEAQARRLAIYDNRAGELSSWSAEALRRTAEAGVDLSSFWRPDELTAIFALSPAPSGEVPAPGESATETQAATARRLEERFLVPPFSVLDARQGYWQARKSMWIDGYGIQSELGREFDGPVNVTGTDFVTAKNAEVNERRIRRAGTGMAQASGNQGMRNYRKAGTGGSQAPYPKVDEETGEIVRQDTTPMISVFDPVLCELAYRWFSPAGGRVLDPFAGGSVRGIVAGVLGREYEGVELSTRQVEANREQAGEINPAVIPTWFNGDSRAVVPALDEESYDFVFSCPPYFDLEIYSEDERDLSQMTWEAFREAYQEIITGCVRALKPNRFACFVIGDCRDPQGFYRNLVFETAEMFERAGARFYNEAVLVQPLGSLPLRAAFIFAKRKLGKTHQNVLVFCKGDPELATEACGEVEVSFDLVEPAQTGDPVPVPIPEVGEITAGELRTLGGEV